MLAFKYEGEVLRGKMPRIFSMHREELNWKRKVFTITHTC